MGGFLFLVFLIWLAWQIVKPAFDEAQADTERTNINTRKDQIAPLDDWKNKLTPKYQRFLEKSFLLDADR